MRVAKIISLIVLLIITGTGYGQDVFSDINTLTIPAEGKIILEIRTPQNLRCDILVETHAKNTVDIEYRKWARAKSLDRGKRFVNLIEIQLDDKSRDKQGLRLKVLAPTKAPWEGTDYGIGLDLDIKVPENFIINSHSSYGAIELIGPFKGTEVYNEYGSIEIENVKGALVVKASYSQVELLDIEGTVLIETQYEGISGEDITITDGPGIFETSYGPVNLKKIIGSVEAYTGYGPINVSDIDAGTGSIVLTTSYSPVKAENITGEIICKTSYGPINMENIRLTGGMSKIETKYAPINIAINNINDTQLLINNIYNSINVFFESDISAKLLLAVDEGGKIHTQGFSIKPITMDKTRLVGIVGDGRSKIELNIDGIGEINIKSK
ncbi:MAG TPA: hypothetical protein ENL22_02415 [candidate division Zixibacteria bacterium]|nr:hypothetical protein [candidate division Zixibacteria bacterium]